MVAAPCQLDGELVMTWVVCHSRYLRTITEHCRWMLSLCLVACVIMGTSSVAAASKSPRRIVSLAPSVTETIYWIGAEDRLCGVTTWCNYPPAAKALPRVGSYSAPSVELVVALQPDLIIAEADGTRPDIIHQLQNLDLNVWIYDVQSFDDFVRFVSDLGRQLNVSERAEVSLEALNTRIQQYLTQVATQPPVRVIGVVQQQPLIVAAPETWPGMLMTMAGGTNVVASGRFRYPHYSEEQVVADRPEVINPLLIQRLAQEGAEVITLSEVPRSLEDVYLKIVEE